MISNPYLLLAQQKLDREPGDPGQAYITPADVQKSYEYLRQAWLLDDDGSGEGGGGGGSGNGGVSVKTYGAVGDGETDDTDAILAAIEAAGDGGFVFFPDGVYVISRPLIPRTGQRLEGTWQTYYCAGIRPSRPLSGRQGTVITASPDFEGEGMIMCAQYTYGVHITRLGIIGPGPDHPSGCHGIKMPTRSQNTGETSWWIEECLINSMPGHGVTGHMWVIDLRDTHISQCSWGVAVTGTDGMLDTRVIGCMFYFNRDGGFLLDGGWTGAIEIIGCRVERSGNLYGYPSTPVNPYAPGVRIRRGQQVILTNVSTDANTGPGLWIGNPNYNVYNILVANCAWARDGGGTQEIKEWWDWVDGEYVQVPDHTPDADIITGEGIPGVWFDRCFDVKMINNIVGYGKHDDSDDVEGPISPGYAFKANNTWQCEVSSTRFEVIPFERSLNIDDTNQRLDVHLPQHSLMKVPVAGEARWLPTMKQIGLVAYQNDLQTLVVQNYNGDWVAMLSYNPNFPYIRMPRTVDLNTRDGSQQLSLRFVSSGTDDPDGYGRLRWNFGVNPEQYNYTFFLGRYGDDGEGNLEAYIDDPFAVNYRTGRVELNHTYLRSRDGSDIAFIVRGFDDQTRDLQQWWSDSAVDGVDYVAGVRPDGRIWGSPGSSPNDFVTVSQLTSGPATSYIQLEGTTAQDKNVQFITDDVLAWQLGCNPSGAFYIWKADETGSYDHSIFVVNPTSSTVTLTQTSQTSRDPDIPVASMRGAVDQSVDLQRWVAETTDPDGLATTVSTVAGVRPDGRVWGTPGTSPNDFATVSQINTGGGGASPVLQLSGTSAQDKNIQFITDDVLAYQLGVNPQGAFYVWKADAAGDYDHTIFGVNPTSSTVSMPQISLVSRDPSIPVAQVRGAVDQTANLQRWIAETTDLDGINTTVSAVAGVFPDGRVWGSDATAADEFVTKGQLDAAVAGGGGTSWTNALTIEGLSTQYSYLEFKSNGAQTWEIGVNPDASGNAFYIDRFVSGTYVDTPFGISKSTGLITQGKTFLRALAPADIPLTVRAAVDPTVSMFRVEDSAGSSKFEVLWNGKVRAAWGSTAFAMVQQGCTQIVRQGASSGNTLLACYTSTDNADADDSVFEVYGNGSVKCAPAGDRSEAMNLGQLKDVVAASTSWEDFQSRVAAL